MTWLNTSTSVLLIGLQLLGSARALAYDSSKFSAVPRNWGLGGGTGVDALNAQRQMKTSCSASGIVVAVIDTGIDPTHPALKNSLWVNAKEKLGKTGVDDDGDGFVDNVHGWDFVRSSGTLVDQHGHGTHIAGIIAGQNKAENYLGVCPGVQVMSLRYYDPNGSGEDNLRNTVRAIDFAVAHKVNIINYSGGGAEYSTIEYKALKRAQDAGILVVAAAGNEKSDADKNLYFPAAYDLDNIISVTAIADNGAVLPSSNWGLKKVHVAAPGKSILSTLPGGNYGVMTGTSQATAFVTGIAAMLLSDGKTMSYQKVRDTIEVSAVKAPQLAGKTRFGARVSAFAALMLMRNNRKVSSEKEQKASAKVLEAFRGGFKKKAVQP
jgi:thermitase